MFFDYQRLVELKGIRHELMYQSNLMARNSFQMELDAFLKRRAEMTKNEKDAEDKAMWQCVQGY